MPEYPLLDLATQRPEPGHYIYRLFDGTGSLLYVGSTGNLWERFGQHAGRLRYPWWGDVDFARTVIERVGDAHCPGARSCRQPEHDAMRAREKELISTLLPRYNLNLTGYCRRGLHLLSEHGKLRTSGLGCYTCQLEQMRIKYAEEKRKAAAEAGQLTLED